MIALDRTRLTDLLTCAEIPPYGGVLLLYAVIFVERFSKNMLKGGEEGLLLIYT